MKTSPFAPLAALLLALSTPCQGDAEVVVATEPGTFVLEAGNLDVATLIDRVAAYLDYNILANEQELASLGQIRVTRRTEVDHKGCWELFGSLLYFKSLAVVVLDQERGFFEVISMNGPRSSEISNGALFVPCDEVAAYANQKATPILTTVPLQNINATIATNALRPFYAGSGSMSRSITLGNVGNNSCMLLQGFGPQVAAACRLLKLVDIGDDNGRQHVQVVRIEHAAAQDLVMRIAEVFDARTMQGMQQGIQQGGPVMNTGLRAVAHPELNSLILTGSTAQIRDALDLIARLDAPAPTPRAARDDMGQRMQQLEERVQKLEQGLRSVKAASTARG